MTQNTFYTIGLAEAGRPLPVEFLAITDSDAGHYWARDLAAAARFASLDEARQAAQALAGVAGAAIVINEWAETVRPAALVDENGARPLAPLVELRPGVWVRP